MSFVTNVIRNTVTGQLVVFGTAESLSYIAHGKGIFIMIDLNEYKKLRPLIVS